MECKNVTIYNKDTFLIYEQYKATLGYYKK